MPRVIRESFNESEAEDNKTASKGVSEASKNESSKNADSKNVDSKNANLATNKSVNNDAKNANSSDSSSDSSSTVVRRRRGRRVTRGAGAAGEAMELKVEESHSKGVDTHTVQARPITSLLFQEPVIPAHVNSHANRDEVLRDSQDEDSRDRDSRDRDSRDRDSREDSQGNSRSNSRSNSRGNSRSNSRNNSRGNSGGSSRENTRNSRDFSQDDLRDDSRDDLQDNSQDFSQDNSQDSERENTRDSRRRHRNRNRGDNEFSENNNRNENNDRNEMDDDSQPRKLQRSRRSRRLNAVERRAAAEVEQIEEDLAYDDIVYAPIDTRIDETLDVSDIMDADNGGRRREMSRNILDEDEDDDEGMITRRRRRRRTSRADRDDFSDRADRADSGDDRDDADNRDDRNNLDNRNNRTNRNSRADRNTDRADRADRNADRSDRYDNRNYRNASSKENRDYDDFDEEFDSRIRRENLDVVSQEDRDLIPDPDEFRSKDEEETLYTRRRRRRRSKSSEDSYSSRSQQSQQSQQSSRSSQLSKSDAQSDLSFDAYSSDDDDSSRRSRKQQYIDEITDIEGSTRLEAKRQRRRDNRRERARQSLIMEQDFLARRENVERLMVVRERDRHTQISVIEDNILVEHYVSDIQEVATVGNIYLGRIQNVLPSMEAAFVDIGQARNGVLYAGEVNWDTTRLEGQPRRIELAFKSGDPVLVQVTKDPIGHKGARLTSQVTLAGRFLVLVPSGGMTGVSRKLSDRERSRLRGIVAKIAPKDMGIIIRTAAEGASEEAIEKDLESLVKQWDRIEAKRQEYLHGKRPKLLQGEPDVAIRVVRDIFNDDFQKLIVEGEGVRQRIDEYLEMMAPDLRSKVEYWDPAEHEGKDVFDKWQIDSQLRKGMERQVYLPAGGSIVIDRTEAMTTIDVNTGRFIGRGKSLEETVTRCNLEASEEIARQLRLRDIGGMVMIDYVDMVMPANRDLVLRRLLECLARDRTKHQVAEVTSLGLVQMTRKRVGQGLVEAFSEECPMCKGRGFILHDEPTVSSEYADPYALKGGDPFVKTNKYGHGSATEQPALVKQGSSADVRAKLARIAAASAISETAGSAGSALGAESAGSDLIAESDLSAEESIESAEFTEESIESADSTEEFSAITEEFTKDSAEESTEESAEGFTEESSESTESTESTSESSENYAE